MIVVWVVLKDGRYQEVSKEEYDAFDGEKFMAPSYWRLMLGAAFLLPLRWD